MSDETGVTLEISEGDRFSGSEECIKLTVEEWEAMKKLIEVGIELEETTYDLAKEIAIEKTEELIGAAIDEILDREKIDDGEKDLMIRLGEDKEFLDRLKNIIKK